MEPHQPYGQGRRHGLCHSCCCHSTGGSGKDKVTYSRFHQTDQWRAKSANHVLSRTHDQRPAIRYHEQPPAPLRPSRLCSHLSSSFSCTSLPFPFSSSFFFSLVFVLPFACLCIGLFHHLGESETSKASKKQSVKGG